MNSEGGKGHKSQDVCPLRNKLRKKEWKSSHKKPEDGRMSNNSFMPRDVDRDQGASC
jgi:hypothetical protein